MTVQQARQAANGLVNWLNQPYNYGVKAGKELAEFVLTHFPEDGDEPVTEDWLRNEYDKNSTIILDEYGDITVCNGKIHGCTRQQARQLLSLLGIKKRGSLV